MKKYTIEIIEGYGKMSMKRHNEGFKITELIGFSEIIKNDLLVQYASMMNKPDKITRSFISKNKKGEVIVKGELL